MRVRLIIVLLLMPAIPIAGLGWLALSTYRDEAELLSHRRQALLRDKLHRLDTRLAAQITSYERALREQLHALPADPEQIRAMVRRSRLTRTLFRLDEQGRLLFPAKDALSDAERAFVARSRRILAHGEMRLKPKETLDQKDTCAWFVWHYDAGMQLVYRCTVDGRIVGAELDPVVVASDLIAALPETGGKQAEPSNVPLFRIRLLDVNDEVLYQFGRYDPGPGESPLVSLKLRPPLASFRLTYFAPADVSAPFGRSARFGLALGFAALLVVVAGLCVYIIRESNRGARTARERMTFVNQVSHELKTPLTNLRMYAELLDDYLEEDDTEGRRYVKVIIEESERLSRLILNVLSFARNARGKLTIRKGPAVPDAIVRETAQRFRPGFEQAGIRTTFDLNAEETRLFDRDALSQILSNLLSNVEKYAASGRHARIETRLDGELLKVTVRDAGEGIPAGREEEIFKPFVRLSNKLTDRAAGTGIGLAISRDIARHHGGDLTVEPGTNGAALTASLLAPKTPTEGEST